MSTTGGMAPIKPQHLSIRIEEQGDAIIVGMREGHLGAGIFMLLWLTAWTVGCAALLLAVINDPQPFLVIFAVPFWASWLFGGGCLASIFFGRRHFVLDSEGLLAEWHVVIALSRRLVPLPELRRFQERQLRADGEGNVTTVIEAVTLGRSITFGGGLSGLERSWLRDRLEQKRCSLQQGQPLSSAPVDRQENEDLLDCRACAAPSDCSWSAREDYDGLSFEQRGRFSAGALLGLLFINAFWNGIVAVFLGVLFGLAPGNKPLAGGEWWMMFFFLIPFEAIGLVMLVGLLAQMLEPFRLTRWTITAAAIERKTTRLGLPLGWHYRYPQESFADAAIRDDLGSTWTSSKAVSASDGSGEQYGLLLASADRREICSIRGLTLGEARWMKGRLQEFCHLR